MISYNCLFTFKYNINTIILLYTISLFAWGIALQAQEPDMVLVKGGWFIMGSDSGSYDEQPAHKVSVSDFFIDKYEVTNRQYCEFLNTVGNQIENGKTWLDMGFSGCRIEFVNDIYRPKKGFDDNPVIEVTWFGANAYAKWMGKRLPTEAEWEYAAQGGINSESYILSGSNDASTVAWFQDNSNGKTHPVGIKQPNELGIHDMSGNVWEWCSDWYSENYYEQSLQRDPTGPLTGTQKVLRGGAWNVMPLFLNITNRSSDTPNFALNIRGFRCVKSFN